MPYVLTYAAWIEETNKRSFYGGLAAVATVLIIMALFVTMAFLEPDDDTKPETKKSQ